MELLPTRTRRQRELLDAARRSAELIDATTPDPDPVDPALFDPVQRNPQVVTDAINALAQSRVEGSRAADRLAQDAFNRQIQQLILSQVLGVGGAIANLNGAGLQTGIDQNIARAQQTALGLQDRLTQQLISGVQDRAQVEGQASLDVARTQEEANIANQLEVQRQRQEFAQALVAAEDRARREGIDVRDALQQEIVNRRQERQLDITAANAAANQARAEASLIGA
jgi:hypothetical protein